MATSKMPNNHKFAVVSGTISGSVPAYSAKYSYPSGFNFSNCLAISICWVGSTGTLRYTGEGASNSTFQRFFARLDQDGIDVYNTEGTLKGLIFYVTLMRIDL